MMSGRVGPNGLGTAEAETVGPDMSNRKPFYDWFNQNKAPDYRAGWAQVGLALLKANGAHDTSHSHREYNTKTQHCQDKENIR